MTEPEQPRHTNYVYAPYVYIREDNGEAIAVDFDTMMTQDSAGFITLPDGVAAKRLHQRVFTSNPDGKDAAWVRAQFHHVSDSMGVSEHQLEEVRNLSKEAGFSGVEFKQDPSEASFYQAHFTSETEMDRYVKWRFGGHGVDKNRTLGAALSAESMSEAERIARERFNF